MSPQTQFPPQPAKESLISPACVGVYLSVESARSAVEKLRAIGIQNDTISVFTPGPARHPLSAVETSDTEQGGMGAAMAGSIFGALGLGLGVILFVPVIGAVSVLGALAAGLMGAGSAAAGVAVGSMLERKSLLGLLPVDEIYLYEDALAQGRSIVLVTPSESLRDKTVAILKEADAESIDAAKESWWVGVRDGRKLSYEAPEHTTLWDDPLFRAGFEAGLHPEATGESELENDAERMQSRLNPANTDVFALGYAQGRSYGNAKRNQANPSRECPSS